MVAPYGAYRMESSVNLLFKLLKNIDILQIIKLLYTFNNYILMFELFQTLNIISKE